MPAIFFLILFPLSLLAQWPCETSGPTPFQDHDKWGYLSDSGVVISPHFNIAGLFFSDQAIACVADQCGLIDTTGSFIGQTWDRQSRPHLQPFSEGLAAVFSDHKWGYIDSTGQVAIPYQFVDAERFDHGMARVSIGGKFFFIDKTGTRVTPEFDGAFDFHEDLAAVEVGKKVGYIRRDGSFAIPPLHASASAIDFSEGLAAVRLSGKVGFMDKNGNVVIAPKYDDVFPFSDGLAPVELNDKWGYIDLGGKLVVPIQFEIAHMFSEGLASVYTGKKWGFIDRTGSYVIPPTFDSAFPFCAGLAAVETYQVIGQDHHCRGPIYKGKHGMIDHHGNYVWRDAEDQQWSSMICH